MLNAVFSTSEEKIRIQKRDH